MPNRKWVCDASPIILLAKVRRADLLLSLPSELAIPKAVVQEVLSGPEGSSAVKWVRSNRSDVSCPEVSVSPQVVPWDLDEGENAVLSWAQEEPRWTVVLDDLAGRRCAKALGLSVTGTLGILLLAKEEGAFPEVRPVLEALVEAGLQASDNLLEEVLQRAGEAS